MFWHDLSSMDKIHFKFRFQPITVLKNCGFAGTALCSILIPSLFAIFVLSFCFADMMSWCWQDVIFCYKRLFFPWKKPIHNCNALILLPELQIHCVHWFRKKISVEMYFKFQKDHNITNVEASLRSNQMKKYLNFFKQNDNCKW